MADDREPKQQPPRDSTARPPADTDALTARKDEKRGEAEDDPSRAPESGTRDR